MKYTQFMKYTQLVIALACILNADYMHCKDLTNNTDHTEHKAVPCPLLLKNTSGSPIWISHDSKLADKPTLDELEQASARVIQPYEIEAIDQATTFAIYTRIPQSNSDFQKNFTVVQRFCDPDNDEYVIDYSVLVSNQADSARFIVIDHVKEKDIPESAYPLCPGGKLPELDQETDQWLCKIYRYSDVYEKHVDEYVPVLSYIYQWLPSSIWTQWYIKHPQFYHWYHRHPDFYSHLPNYQAPWQTKEYATWYNAQSEKVRSTVREPEAACIHIATGNENSPLGFAENKVKTKNKIELQKSNKPVVQPIAVHAKEQKKQKIEDIISSDNAALMPEVKKEEKKKIVQITRALKYYDRKTKPMAVNKRCVLKTQSGNLPVTL